jgi:hypothetical protein
MLSGRLPAYTVVLWLSVSLFAAGCGGTGDSGSSTTPASEAAQSQTDPELPTVTLPEDDAGASTPTTDSNDSTE